MKTLGPFRVLRFRRSSRPLLASLEVAFLVGSTATADVAAQAAQSPAANIWPARQVTIRQDARAARVRIGIWDSGVDTSLFPGQLARDGQGRLLVRGYNAFKEREDTPMEVLPASILGRAGELNEAFLALDDLDRGVESARANAFVRRLGTMAPMDSVTFQQALGRWGGYTHGTAIADAAVAGNPRAEIVVARMEWWHGSPPVPCWSRALADREAATIRDQLAFLVASGARVVNMSWGRHEGSYRRALAECAPAVPEADRNALARYTVDSIRAVLRAGMRASPDVLFVGAAGNEGSSVTESNPATRFSLPNFLLVGAVDLAGARTAFTNTGPEVTLFAQGVAVPGRLPGGAVLLGDGTSVAAPLVTNAAAKVLAVNPRLSGADMRRLLETTADTNSSGDRLLHAARAVEAARGIR